MSVVGKEIEAGLKFGMRMHYTQCAHILSLRKYTSEGTSSSFWAESYSGFGS